MMARIVKRDARRRSRQVRGGGLMRAGGGASSVLGLVQCVLLLMRSVQWLSQGMITMWLKEGGAVDALQHIKHARRVAASAAAMSQPPPPPPITPWMVMDDAELFAGARMCLQQARNTIHLHFQLFLLLLLSTSDHNPLPSAWIRRPQGQNR